MRRVGNSADQDASRLKPMNGQKAAPGSRGLLASSPAPRRLSWVWRMEDGVFAPRSQERPSGWREGGVLRVN